MSAITDDWLARAQAGDESALAAIFTRYERQIFSFIYRMMGDPDDAYDLTQDCFVKAFRSLGRFGRGGDDNLSAWLHRIAHNACLDVLRRRQRLRWLPWVDAKHDHRLIAAAYGDNPEREAERSETNATVQLVLSRMSHRHRMALLLREYEGLSCQELGEVMGLSRSAVKSMLFRARDEFRQIYAAIGQEKRLMLATSSMGFIHLVHDQGAGKTVCGIQYVIWSGPGQKQIKAGWEPARHGDARLATCRTCQRVVATKAVAPSQSE